MALAGATNCRQGDLTWHTRGKKLRTRRERQVIFGRCGRGGRGADGRIAVGGHGTKERQTGGRGPDGRTGGRHREWRWTGGQADESRQSTNKED